MAFLRRRRRTSENDQEPLPSNGTNNPSTSTKERPRSLRKLLVRSWSRGSGTEAKQVPSPREKNATMSPPSYVKGCSLSHIAEGTVERDREETASQLSELSEESLLEAWTANDEASLVDYHGIDRIRKHLEHRGRLFYRCTANKSKFYRDIILARELQSRARLLQSYNSNDEMLHQGLPVQADTTIGSPNTSQAPATTAAAGGAESSRLRRLQGILLLEGHSLEAAWIALFYSTGHQSLYMVLDGLVKLGLSHSGLAPNNYYSIIFFLGLFMIRMNGYLWFWLGQESYRLVKFEVHNRQCLQYWDAQVLSWFRQGKYKWINGYVSILGYYFLYIGMVYFYYSHAWVQLEAWNWKAYTILETTLRQQMNIKPKVTGADLCEAMSQTQAWYRHGAQFLCHQWYTQEVPSFSILYDGSILFLSMIAIRLLGGDLFAE